MKVSRKDGLIKVFSFDDAEGKEAFRHTAAHILAQAVKSYILIPNVQLVRQLRMVFTMILSLVLNFLNRY